MTIQLMSIRNTNGDINKNNRNNPLLKTEIKLHQKQKNPRRSTQSFDYINKYMKDKRVLYRI